MTQSGFVVSREALSPSAAAFDAVAEQFDERFGPWLSVAAQRRAVRDALVDAFPLGATVLEIGGGTGEDACWLSRQGRRVLLTDPSPTMVRVANEKLAAFGAPAPQVWGAEELSAFADERERAGEPLLHGAFSNFAALNCVRDLSPVAHGLARMIKPQGAVLLVLFGTCPPGEWLVEFARRRPRSAFRRMSRRDVAARLSGREFVVRYHRARDVRDAFTPWFRLVSRRGIGVFVPPSAAEPWISSHPRLLSLLETLDRGVSRPFAALGDHVLYHLERTTEPA